MKIKRRSRKEEGRRQGGLPRKEKNWRGGGTGQGLKENAPEILIEQNKAIYQSSITKKPSALESKHTALKNKEISTLFLNFFRSGSESTQTKSMRIHADADPQ
jgi:hypothetical protein